MSASHERRGGHVGRTNGTELRVVLPHTFHRMQLHLDFLPWPQLGEDYPCVGRRWPFLSERRQRLLLALRNPFQVCRRNFGMYVELLRFSGARRGRGLST